MLVIVKNIIDVLPVQVVGLTFFGLMGFGPKTISRLLFFWGNNKKADAATVQIDSFRGFCRFFFWVGLAGSVIQNIIIVFQQA